MTDTKYTIKQFITAIKGLSKASPKRADRRVQHQAIFPSWTDMPTAARRPPRYTRAGIELPRSVDGRTKSSRRFIALVSAFEADRCSTSRRRR